MTGIHAAWLHSTDVVGFAFGADTYCVPDTLVVLGVMRSPKKAGATQAHVSTFIKIYGRQKLNLKNDDPRWKDSTVIPQPIFTNEAADMTCGHCKEALL